MLVVELYVGSQIAIVAVQVTGIDVGSRSHRKQIRDCSANDCSLETVCVRDGPGGHETAVTPSAHAQVIRISDSTRYQLIHAVHTVLKIAKAPVTIVCFGKRRSGAIRTARIGEKYSVTMRRENASPVIPIAVKTSGPGRLRPAVIMNDRFVTFPFGVARMQKKNARRVLTIQKRLTAFFH